MHTVEAVEGFQFSGVACGIKNNAALDLGLVFAPNGASIGAVYTENLVVAAPVVLSRNAPHKGRINALIVNSGNANACTGRLGAQNAQEMLERTAEYLEVPVEKVQVCSTGVIGQNLPMARIREGLEQAVKNLSSEGSDHFAEAIRTTDLYRKVARKTVSIGSKQYVIQGIAKGAGMIAPNMATMLAYVFSDAPIESDRLQLLWKRVCDKTFNAMTVDGDTSTNDTAIILCSGGSKNILTHDELTSFEAAVLEVCDELAHLIVGDGEGATKAVRVKVTGASTSSEAKQVADVVARSPLVKTALHGEDPNWGRIVAAVGRSGVTVVPEKIQLSFGEVSLYENGRWSGEKAEAAVIEIMKQPRYEITVDLGLGEGSGAVLTCDLTAEYIRINADYRS